MNTQAVKFAARRAGRYNLWVAVAIATLALVLVVKAQTRIDTRHFEAPVQAETAR